ncbi:MAG: BadF/BadG/BcrA/BcrD ATPase family protein, partial [Brachybacterium sp.]
MNTSDAEPAFELPTVPSTKPVIAPSVEPVDRPPTDDVAAAQAGHGDMLPTRSEAPSLLIAGDIGGTSSRVVLAQRDGSVVAEAEGPGANLRSSGVEALDNLVETVREVLSRGRGELEQGVQGHDGLGAVGERLTQLGIDPARVLITDDLHTGFLAGGVGDDGLLVLAGTGAVAVRFQDREAVARRDGMGWLLGDIGSAVWLGRRTLEAVAADIDGRGPRTLLTEEVGE